MAISLIFTHFDMHIRTKACIRRLLGVRITHSKKINFQSICYFERTGMIVVLPLISRMPLHFDTIGPKAKSFTEMTNMPTRQGHKHQNQSVKVLVHGGLGNSNEHFVLHFAFSRPSQSTNLD